MVESRVYALYPLRITLATVFVSFGVNKLFTDPAGTTAFFAAEGIPLARATVFLVGVAELLGGLGILAGVLPRFSAAVLSVVMTTAILFVQLPGPLLGGWGLDLALLGGLLTVLLNGAGRPTLQSIVSEWRTRRSAAGSARAT